MKKITNQKIDIPKLFERYMIYIYSTYSKVKDPLKEARKIISDYYYNEEIIKNEFEYIFDRMGYGYDLEPKSYYDLELKLSIRGF